MMMVRLNPPMPRYELACIRKPTDVASMCLAAMNAIPMVRCILLAPPFDPDRRWIKPLKRIKISP